MLDLVVQQFQHPIEGALRGMKRDEGLIDALYDTLVVVPGWVGPILAAASYPFVRYLIPQLLSGGTKDPLSALSQTLAPFAPVLVLMVWLAVEFKKWRDRRRLDRTEGLHDVRRMSWSEFEALVGEAYRRQDYIVEETGSAAGDGGVDLALYCDGQKTLVQCKHWRNRQVGVKVVRELRGAMTDAGAVHGALVCCGGFTPEAERFAERNNIELVNGAALEQMIADARKNRIPRSGAADDALKPAGQAAPSQADRDAPPCPACGSPMVLKTARKGPHPGSKFWGCPRFPRCRGTRQVE